MKKLICTSIIVLFSYLSIAQMVFNSDQELNTYIFQNSNLNTLTNGYLLDFENEWDWNSRDSLWIAIQNGQNLSIGHLLTVLNLLERTDVNFQFEKDSLLFPVMDHYYANNGHNAFRVPLFICDIKFDQLKQDTYNNFSNSSGGSPFPALSSSQVESRDLFLSALFIDTIVNDNVVLYWDENTFVHNTDREILEVTVTVNGIPVVLPMHQELDLRGYYSSANPLTSIEIQVLTSDSVLHSFSQNVYIKKADVRYELVDLNEDTDNRGNVIGWSNLGGLNTYGVLTDPIEAHVAVLWGCGEEKVLDKPFILVSGWGPYTDNNTINSAQSWPSSIADLYPQFNQQGFIDELTSVGFDVIIVKFFPPNANIIANMEQLIKLINLVNKEKYLNNSYEENIVLGYSAGAMCVRLALQRMEFLHMGGNAMHHHSKLFVSFDGEHGGANIPLGLQHSVKYLEEHQGNWWQNTPWMGGFNCDNLESPLAGHLSVYALHYILNAPLSKQLLKYFHTQTNGNLVGQGEHPDRLNYLSKHVLFNHNKNEHVPGYPSFCRRVSISNGASTSSISGSFSNHYPYPNLEGHVFFQQTNPLRSWKASMLQPGVNSVFEYKKRPFPFSNWIVEMSAYTNNPWIIDNAPGGTTFLESDGSSCADMNTVFQVVNLLDDRIDGQPTIADYRMQYAFTPTLLTHDIKNWNPNQNQGRLDYSMKDMGLMYDNLAAAIIDDPNNASSFYGYPHLFYPETHYTEATPFDAVFSWDGGSGGNGNTVHITSGTPFWNGDGHDGRGKWYQENNVLVSGAMKNFIVHGESDFYNAFIQNREYGWNAREDYTYKADIKVMNEILIGKDVTQRTNFKDAKVLTNGDLTCEAETAITIRPGFHVEPGGSFHAKIAPYNCQSSSGMVVYGGNSKPAQEAINARESFHTDEVPDQDDADVITIFPNPGTGSSFISIESVNFKQDEQWTYTVFDISGKRILSGQETNRMAEVSLPTGVYIVRVNYNGAWHIKKLLMH